MPLCRQAIVLAVVALVAGCGAESPPRAAGVATSAPARTFRSTAFGYSFEYPPDWQGGIPPAGPAEPRFFAPRAAADGYQPSIGIGVEALSETIDVQELERRREALLAQHAEGSELLSTGATTVSGLEAAWFEYHVTAGGVQLRCRQVVVIHGSNAFSIVLSATDTSFDESLAAETEIERTFRFEA